MIEPNRKTDEFSIKRTRRGLEQANHDLSMYPPIPEAQQYKELITNFKCSCGTDLKDEPIHAYAHDGGWEVEGHGLMWLWITCPGCGYQHAIWKLGVSRSARA